MKLVEYQHPDWCGKSWTLLMTRILLMMALKLAVCCQLLHIWTF